MKQGNGGRWIKIDSENINEITYITDPVKIKILLSKYPLLKTLLNNLKLELQTVYQQGTGFIATSEEILEMLALGNKPYSDMPRAAPVPGDSVNKMIYNYPKILNSEYKHLWQGLEKEIIAIDTVIKKIDNALSNTLFTKNNQQEIIKLKHFQGKTWKEISALFNMSSFFIKKDVYRPTIETICTTIKINSETYNYVLSLAELEAEKQKRLEREMEEE